MSYFKINLFNFHTKSLHFAAKYSLASFDILFYCLIFTPMKYEDDFEEVRKSRVKRNVEYLRQIGLERQYQ